ncbi:hypothetical protein AX16_010913 [Volvariella volvacea WC 439]|nr:hypothetical protein AX16_010913 [Volvariella volvacea WC 439]
MLQTIEQWVGEGEMRACTALLLTRVFRSNSSLDQRHAEEDEAKEMLRKKVDVYSLIKRVASAPHAEKRFILGEIYNCSNAIYACSWCCVLTSEGSLQVQHNTDVTIGWAAAQKHIALGKAGESLAAHPRKPGSFVNIVLYINEAHELTTTNASIEEYGPQHYRHTLYNTPLSVTTTFKSYPIFFIFLSTTCRIQPLAPPPLSFRSARALAATPYLNASITETPFHCAPNMRIIPRTLSLDPNPFLTYQEALEMSGWKYLYTGLKIFDVLDTHMNIDLIDREEREEVIAQARHMKMP